MLFSVNLCAERGSIPVGDIRFLQRIAGLHGIIVKHLDSVE